MRALGDPARFAAGFFETKGRDAGTGVYSTWSSTGVDQRIAAAAMAACVRHWDDVSKTVRAGQVAAGAVAAGCYHPEVAEHHAADVAAAGRVADLTTAVSVCDAALAHRAGSTLEAWTSLETRRALLAGRVQRLTFRHSGTYDQDGNPVPVRRHHPEVPRRNRTSRTDGSAREASFDFAAADAEGRQVAILGDLCGPKMRLRNVPDGGVFVAPGDRFLLYPVGGQLPEGVPYPAFAASVPSLCEDCRPGERVLIADGRIVGEIDTISSSAVTVTVTTGGLIEDRKGVNLPDTELRAAALTPKDIADVAAGVAAGIDVFALSFVRTASDVAELRTHLPAGTPVIAKIERPEALANFDEICEEADGVMVARGDLGVEVGWEVLPGLQMDLVAAAAARGKLSIVATEMLESMTHSTRPTRAEVSDVAAAVMEGASAVMLSAETAMGHDPARVVATMAAILSGIESHRRYWMRNANQVLGVKDRSRPAAIAAAATRLARDIDAVAIASIAHSGAAARLVSAARPFQPTVALCSSERLARSLALWWGVQTMHIGPDKLTDDELRAAVRAVIGDTRGPVVVVSGAHGGTSSDRVRIIDL